MSIPSPTLSYPATAVPRPLATRAHRNAPPVVGSRSGHERPNDPYVAGDRREPSIGSSDWVPEASASASSPPHPKRSKSIAPRSAHPNSSPSVSNRPVLGFAHRRWYASWNSVCPASANTNTNSTTRPTTETNRGTASMKHATTERSDSKRVIARNGRSARSARNARSPPTPASFEGP